MVVSSDSSRQYLPNAKEKAYAAQAALVFLISFAVFILSGSLAFAKTPVIDCSGLLFTSIQDTVIEKAVIEDEYLSSPYLAAGSIQEHCLVTGIIKPRVGVINPDTGSNMYGTRFELRLPTSWNGRFFYQGGSAANGTVVRADGVIPSQGKAQQIPALWRGYVVVSSDSGHQSGYTGPTAMFRSGFGVDPQARVDYGYRSIDVVSRVAKALIASYYGTEPEYSYFIGCSKGGQEAMQASQRYGDQFDGIVAGDPGFHIPQAAVNQVADNQLLAAAAETMHPGLVDIITGEPLLWGAFSQQDLTLVVKALTQSCDELDGLADGLIFLPENCAEVFDPEVLRCRSSMRQSCLSHIQIDTLKKMMSGVRNNRDVSLYSDFPYDTGLNSTATGGWVFWKLGIHWIPINLAINFSIGDDVYRYIFSTPPDADLSLLQVDPVDFDASTRAVGTDPHTGVVYDVSSIDFMVADNTDLNSYLGHGGKLILYHGASDPVFSLFDTLNYYDSLQQRYGHAIDDFVRVFVVPGMGHCSDGTRSANSFDSLTAIEEWVERGTAPDRIIARAGNAEFQSTENTLPESMTRPLCPYPKYARYDGGGNPDDADSFECIAPATLR